MDWDLCQHDILLSDCTLCLRAEVERLKAEFNNYGVRDFDDTEVEKLKADKEEMCDDYVELVAERKADVERLTKERDTYLGASKDEFAVNEQLLEEVKKLQAENEKLEGYRKQTLEVKLMLVANNKELHDALEEMVRVFEHEFEVNVIDQALKQAHKALKRGG